MTKYNFFDTDLFIHRRNPDPALKEAAENVFKDNHPSAMSAFSLVELKGNYIQDLILLYKKIYESDGLKRAYAKIVKTGGRKRELMFAILISWLGDFSPHPWHEARLQLLTFLDSQLATIWEDFRESVDLIFDDFKCSRVEEVPDNDNGKWNVSIPHCRKDNTKCSIVKFMETFDQELRNLVTFLKNLNESLMTKELYKIKNIAEQTIGGKFPWEGRTCRQVSDLLIGLQSKSGNKLISSNFKEHAQLHIPLQYSFEDFRLVEKRSK